MSLHRLFTGLIALIGVAALTMAGASPVAAQNPGEPGKFDYYVLTLSWSPAFCASKGANAPQAQCGADKNYGFVVHGLWPQYERSGYPASCSTTRKVPDRIVNETFPIMPSAGLMNHEWEKHGTCSGVDVEKYFADLRAAFSGTGLPQDLLNPPRNLQKTAGEILATLAQRRPDMPKDGVVLSCRNNRINEAMFCLNKDLSPRACGPSVRRSCSDNATLTR